MKPAFFSLLLFLSGLQLSLAQSSDILYQTPKELAAGINSEAEETQPLLSPDGQTLYFVRILHPENLGGKYSGHDIWYAHRLPDGSWQEPRNGLLNLNNKGNNAILSFSRDGQRVYLLNKYEKGKSQEAGISVAEQKDGLWGMPQKLDLPRLHKDGFFYNAHVSEDESVIIVSMKRRKQPYDEDLFVTYRQADGSWSDFTNLGPAINTEGFEITPFLSADKRNLYFASNGHGGLGDADIWMSERQGNGWTQWSKARNLGKPINSAGFDAAFRLYADSSIFFASNRAGGLSNLYESRILSPDDTLDQEEAVPLVFQQKSEAERQAMRPSPEDNSLLASKSGEAIVVEDVYPLSLSIYFAFDSDELSEAARQKLRELFQKYTAGDVRVELTGHTDAVGTQDYNQRLSFRRAYAAQQFLQSAGLAQEQLRADGRGEAEPVASNETEDGRRQNRRVSIRVVR